MLDRASGFYWTSLLVIIASTYSSKSSWPYPMFLINITSLGSNLFSKVWKGLLKNELTSKLSCHLWAQVNGPCIMVGGSAGASEGVISSSGCTLCFYPSSFLLKLIYLSARAHGFRSVEQDLSPVAFVCPIRSRRQGCGQLHVLLPSTFLDFRWF